MKKSCSQLELEETAEIIAEELMGIETLERRWMDGLDFHDVAVWTLKAALVEAIRIGARLTKAGVKIEEEERE